jgi:hypothetical protein
VAGAEGTLGTSPVAGAGAGTGCVAGARCLAAARAATDVLIPWKDRVSEVIKKRPAQMAVTRLRKVTAPLPPNALVAAPPPSAAPIPASLPGWRRMTKIMNTQRRTWTEVRKASIGARTLQKARRPRQPPTLLPEGKGAETGSGGCADGGETGGVETGSAHQSAIDVRLS